MPGFTSYGDITTELITNGKQLTYQFSKVGTTMQGAGNWHSLWTAAGSPVAGAAPAGTPGAAYSSSSGSMNWLDVSTDQKHLISFGAVCNQSCNIMIYDRLVGVGAISLPTVAVKTVSSAALTRYTTGDGVQAWLEVTTATTTSATVLNMSYTNQAGTAGQTGSAITFPAAATVLNALVGPLPLAAGDSGVRAVASLNVTTAPAAGVVNLILIKPIAIIPMIANQWNERDFVMQLAALDRVYDTASLGLAIQASATTAVTLNGIVRLVYG